MFEASAIGSGLSFLAYCFSCIPAPVVALFTVGFAVSFLRFVVLFFLQYSDMMGG